MIGLRIQECSFCILVVVFYSIFPLIAEGSVEDTLAELNAKSSGERQELIVENAKKEGEVVVYTAVNIRDAQQLIAGFNKRYPGIQVSVSSLGGPGVLNKVLTEYRSGAHLADVVVLNGVNAVELIDKKMLARYKSPMVGFLRKGFVDAEGFWPGLYAIGYAIIYNNRRVSQDEAPNRYEDLLQPRWRNNLVMDAESYDLLAGLIDLWGEAKATTFLKKIGQEQKVTFSRQSHTFMTQLVATGEHDVIVDGYVHNGVALIKKGAPLDYVLPTPTIIRPPSTIAMMAQAPHPYAAALFLDYHLSKEASEIMVKSQGRWAARKDVPWSVEPPGDLHSVGMLKWGRNYRDLIELFKKATGR